MRLRRFPIEGTGMAADQSDTTRIIGYVLVAVLVACVVALIIAITWRLVIAVLP